MRLVQLGIEPSGVDEFFSFTVLRVEARARYGEKSARNFLTANAFTRVRRELLSRFSTLIGGRGVCTKSRLDLPFVRTIGNRSRVCMWNMTAKSTFSLPQHAQDVVFANLPVT